MEEQILAVDLSTEQTLEVNLPEQDNVAQIDVYWQDEVVLDLDASLMYIVSGQQEIQDYVDNTSKPEIDDYIETYAKPIVSEVVEEIAAPVVGDYIENTVKPEIKEFADAEMANYAQVAGEQATIATEKASEASETAKIVDEKVQEFSQTTEASKTEFVNFAQEKTEEFEQTAEQATEQAVGSAERSRIWAEGEQAEVELLGGELSSKGWADLAQEKANNAKTSADRAEKIAQGFDGVVNTIEGSIGDIGFAPLGIDETQNKRRYLNGQVISQSQFVSFTNKIKSAIELTPSLATSETNWQAEVTNSPYGICGKFVIDDTLGTIRLPKYPDWSIREVGQAPVIGNGMTLGLTDGTQNYGLDFVSTNNVAFSAHKSTYGKSVGTATGTTAPGSTSFGITTDPTKSGMIADLVNGNTEDKLQGKWFIQVATGTEETVDVTREIELNNPFFLGMSRYFESEPKNASWLISNGAFHSGATYSSFYEWLLKIYNGSETVSGVSVKASTDTYDDFDYVVNTTDTTFRLPIYDGSENLPSSTRINFTDFPYTAPANGFVYIYFSAANSNNRIFVNGNEFLYNQKANSYFGCAFTVPVCRGDVITYGGTLGGDNRFYPCKGNGSLYFYVGETVQDANVVNASSVLTRVAELSDSYISGLGMPSGKYIDLTLGATGTSYIAPASGWFCLVKKSTGGGQSIDMESNGLASQAISTASGQAIVAFASAAKGEKVVIYYTTGGATNRFRFIYAKGEI